LKLSHIATVAAALVPAILSAQSSDTIGQRGRTLIAVNVGLTGTREASANGSSLAARGTGQVASLGITHYVHPSVGIEVSAAVLDENNVVTGTRAHHEEVLPLLFGVNYAPTALAVNGELRPFLSIAAGPYIHSLDDASFSSASASTQTVMGGRVGAGANWYLARHFALQLEGDYHAVPSFDAVDGARRNVSGFALSLGAGFAWGGASVR
jgi:hypothetical protein